MAKLWKIRPHDSSLIQTIEREAKIPAIVAHILALRGVTRPDEVTQFLESKMLFLAKPFELPNMETTCELVLNAIANDEKITVYGDYDCDGMTSTAILCGCIKLLGGNVNYFVPNRLDDGYGVNCDALTRLHAKGTRLVITVDCGISSVAEVEHANQLGMKIIITDHHQPSLPLPAAAAIVHPALPDHNYRFAGLCGAGVALKIAWALCERHHGQEKLPENLKHFLFRAFGLAAIGTVADVVPLVDENRIIVRHGLRLIKQFGGIGLQHLIRVAELEEKDALGSEDIAFTIGPRLNAAGRLGQAMLGVELLLCEDDRRASQIAEYLNELNKSRRSLETGMQKSAEKLIKENFKPENEPALVLAKEDWHKGVLGIVAGRLAEKYHRPTILISIDKMSSQPAVGSCRTSCGVNLYEAIASCKEHLIGFGGHVAAAGLKIQADQIDAFRADFCEHVATVTPPERFEPSMVIDAETLLGQVDFGSIIQLEKLAPFGQKNPRPTFCATDVQLAAPPQTMGAEDKHLRLRLKQHNKQIQAVGFNFGHWAAELEEGKSYDFAFRPSINEYMGRRSVQLKLIDYRPHASDETVPKPKMSSHESNNATEKLASGVGLDTAPATSTRSDEI